MAEGSRARVVFTLLKNLTLAALLYAAIYGMISMVSDPSVAARGKIGIPGFLNKAGPTELIKTSKSGIDTRSGLRKRSNSRAYASGSRSVIIRL